MTMKYSKVLAMAGVAILTSMMVAPALAEDPVVPVATTSVSTTGTIHILSRVLNDNAGTKSPNDFVFYLKHWGTDVAGSPFVGAGNTGTTFVVEAGSYVVSTPIIEGYNGVWFGEGISNGFIDLNAGETITIARIFDDVGKAEIVVVQEPATEDGGILPSTATPWFNLLLVASLIAAAGALGLRKSHSLDNAK